MGKHIISCLNLNKYNDTMMLTQNKKRFTQICVVWFNTILIRPKHINTAMHIAKNGEKVLGSCQQLLLLSLKFGHLVYASAFEPSGHS